MAAAYRRETCRLCGGRDLEPALELTPTPPGDHYVSADRRDQLQETIPLDLSLCRECGLLQLVDVVAPEILYGSYIYSTAHSVGLSDHFRSYANDVIDYAGPPPGALAVDIGSNDGTLLRAFQERGMRVLGIDPAPAAARKATESGVETLPAFFSGEMARRIREERGPAAIVTANNVIANVDDLPGLGEGIRDLLAPGGLFVFETGYALDLVRDMLIDNIYHEHLCYYSVKPLDRLFSRCGLELVEIKRVASKGGSLRGIAQLKGGSRSRSASIDALRALEENDGIHHPASFARLAARIERLREDLWRILDQADREAIAGFGASVGVTTLVYHFNLGEILRFIVDDNPARHRLFSPGYHIPVLPPDALYDRQPRSVIVLAWRYHEPIVKRHGDYLLRGGRFVLPLPEVRGIAAPKEHAPKHADV